MSVKGNGKLLRSLISDIEIINHATNVSISVKAIWDTGATNLVVSPKVIDALGLTGKPTGQTFSDVAGQIRKPTDSFEVDIKLKDNFIVELITVSQFTITDHCDCLIGMDIITMGDFAITNLKGEIIMSYCYPSQHKIDFFADVQSYNNAIKFHTSTYKGMYHPAFVKVERLLKIVTVKI